MLITNARLITWESPNRVLEDHALHIFGFQPGMVTTTIVSGKVLMKDRELLTINEKEISVKAREIAPQVWECYQRELSKMS